MDHKTNYFNRDLSWLVFNRRVLQEAQDPNVPLIERLRFLAIYSSNLDEFFRVRVADIRNLANIGKKKINKELNIKPKKLLKEIGKEVNTQLEEYGHTIQQVTKLLEEKSIFIYNNQDILPQHKLSVLHHFKTKVLTFLRPYFSTSSEKPFINNRELYFALVLEGENKERIYAHLNIPSDRLPRYLELPEIDGKHYIITLDDIIREHLSFVFPEYTVLECCSIKLNKDADLHIEDEYSGDLVEKIGKQIKKRNLGTPSRFLYDAAMSEELLEWNIESLGLMKEDVFPGGRYHNLNDYFQLPYTGPKSLKYDPLPSLAHSILDSYHSLFDAIDQDDQLLHFPYHSYDYILQFFNEAAIDPEVEEIKVAFYRMASNSFIGDALISASKNGKNVTVFMELKARFDEENNLKWAAKMQEAGIKIIYSIPGLKVHAKIALVKKSNGKKYAFFGTGNLNEGTAKIYSDHGLLTCDTHMTNELDQVFAYLYKRKQPKPFEHLLVSQFNMKDAFHSLIDREIEHAKKGKKAFIIIKLNNLEERTMIDKLYEASQAGVNIKMIVRGICCLRPGIEGLSEHITVTRIVDRFLEHARVFIFHNAGNEDIYLGSADWMKRNLFHRIEVAFKIRSEELKNQIKTIIDFQLRDNVKASSFDKEMNSFSRADNSEEQIRAQYETYNWLSDLENKKASAIHE